MAKTRYTGVTKDEKTGKFAYYFKSGVDLATGKPYQEHRRGFATAKEAFEARTRAMNKVQQKGAIKYTNWTYKQFMEEIFMPNFYSTTSLDIERKRQVIFDEFITTFGKKKPRDITTYDILSYRNDLLERHSNTYARSKMALLNQTLRSAKKHGLIFHELPTANVDPIPIVKKPVDFWTKPEFEAVIKSLDRDSYFEQFIFTLLWLYYFTGMRVNEATALYWEDIDFDRKRLTISHNLQYVNRQNWVRHDKLKTESSRRVIGLDNNTLKVLKDWQDRQATVAKIDFILSPDGNPYPKRSIRDQIIKYAKRAGVKSIQPKGLRHFHASLLINEYNVNALFIQRRLGHSDVKTTLSIYSHLYPNADADITEKLELISNDFLR